MTRGGKRGVWEEAQEFVVQDEQARGIKYGSDRARGQEVRSSKGQLPFLSS